MLNKIKLWRAKFRWFIEAIDVVIRNKGSKFEKIMEKRKEIEKRFLLLDKTANREMDVDYIVAMKEYSLINEIIGWLKD